VIYGGDRKGQTSGTLVIPRMDKNMSLTAPRRESPEVA
jgi:hypothetical protein